MPCACGNKVDRAQQKVKCNKCNDFFHLDCVGLLQTDLDFLLVSNKPFFCKVCTAVRRNSFRSPSSPVIMEKATTISDKAVAPISTSENLTECTSKQQITLDSLFNALSALRADNACVLSSLRALHEDKKRLLDKSEVLFAEICSLRSKLDEKDAALTLVTSELKNLRAYVGDNFKKLNTNFNVAANNNNNSLNSRPSLSAAASEVRAKQCSYADVAATTTSMPDNVTTALIGNQPHAAVVIPSTSMPSTLTPVRVSVNSAMAVNAKSTSHIISTAALSTPVSNSSVSNTIGQPQLNADRSNDWVNVRNKKGSKRKNIVVGRNENVDLDIIVKKKWVHISSFKPNVTEDSVIAYVSKNSGIDSKHLACFKLVKKDTPLENLRRINFKFGVSPSFYDKIIDPNVWPADINVKPFRFFQKDRSVDPNK